MGGGRPVFSELRAWRGVEPPETHDEKLDASDVVHGAEKPRGAPIERPSLIDRVKAVVLALKRLTR